MNYIINKLLDSKNVNNKYLGIILLFKNINNYKELNFNKFQYNINIHKSFILKGMPYVIDFIDHSNSPCLYIYYNKKYRINHEHFFCNRNIYKKLNKIYYNEQNNI